MSDQPRDKTTGQWAEGQTITPEHRAKMQAAKRDKHELEDALLEQAGLDPKGTDKPELRIAARKAAGGDMPALKLFLSQTRQLIHKERVVSKGEVINIALSQETVEYLLDAGVGFKLCPKCEGKHG